MKGKFEHYIFNLSLYYHNRIIDMHPGLVRIFSTNYCLYSYFRIVNYIIITILTIFFAFFESFSVTVKTLMLITILVLIIELVPSDEDWLLYLKLSPMICLFFVFQMSYYLFSQKIAPFLICEIPCVFISAYLLFSHCIIMYLLVRLNNFWGIHAREKYHLIFSLQEKIKDLSLKNRDLADEIYRMTYRII